MQIKFELNETQVKLIRAGKMTVEMEWDSEKEAFSLTPSMWSHNYNRLSEQEQAAAMEVL